MRIRALGLAAIGLLVLATSASAATLTLDPVTNSLAYSATAGDTNAIVITWDGTAYTITGTLGAVGVVPAACVAVATPAPGGYRCTDPAGPATAQIQLGDGNDSLDASGALFGVSQLYGNAGDDTIKGAANGYYGYVYGNEGNDTLTGGSAGYSYVYGNAGNDTMTAGPVDTTLYGDVGNDTITGGPGADYVLPGTGNDDVHGGAGIDAVNYSDAAGDVRVSLNDIADDGIAAATANVHGDIESIYGGAGNDALIGSDRANTIYGYGGNDTINGGGGEDSLYGYAGNDTIDGGAGDDYLVGDVGSDVLRGGAGEDAASWYGEGDLPITVWLDGRAISGSAGENDTVATDVEDVYTSTGADEIHGSSADNYLSGGYGADRIYGGGGSDELWGGQGADRLDPGTGNDTVEGGTGSDTILARDRKGDEIRCGGGRGDRVTADRADRVAPDCERISRK
jgi:Ca2+-binding RTX toxin-like protein